MKALRYLDKYFLKYKWRFLAGLVIVVLSNLFYILPAPIVREAVDLVTQGTGTLSDLQDAGADPEGEKQAFYRQIGIYVLLILGVALLRGIFLYLQRQILIGLSRYIEYDLKNDIYAHYQELPLSFYQKNNTGDLMARISEDVSQVRMYLGPAIMYGLNMITLFFIVVPFMLRVDVKLSIYALLPLPLLSVAIYYVNNIINKRSTAIQKELSNLSTFVQEAFSGIRVIRSFVREKDSTTRFEQESNNYREKSLRLTRVDAFFFPLILLLTGLSTILIVYVGGREVIQGTITYGVIAEFVMYINMLTWPVASLGWITSLTQRAEASQHRINEFLNTKTDLVSRKDIKKELEGQLEFRNVSFKYPGAGADVLQKISFEVAAGRSLAILGATGSGKTTLANLICRLYDVDGGSVTVDGVDVRDMEIHALRSQIGYVPQDVFLFSDTIANNITFGANGAEHDRVVQAAKDADLYDNIKDFPLGFDTVLGERGISLSGGQKQRLSIARAIIRDPRILILDDSLSAVDMRTEHTILNSLKRIMQGRTTVVISHRVSSAKLADKIIVLDKGQIAEMGSHDELMVLEGFYYRLYKKQMTVEEEI